ncbi:MAG: hypothetical protein C0440_02060 [Candidatus Pelagibacter sp.]|nr:hypothetical protein [Candidatus Pelagibacter sp.]
MLCVVTILSGCDNWLKNQLDDTDPTGSNPLLYDVTLQGIEDSKILDELNSASKLKKIVFNKPSTEFALQKRIDSDKNLFLKILHKYGYFDAQINIKIAENKKSNNTKQKAKVRIIFQIKTYSKYIIKDISIEMSIQEKEGFNKNLDSITITRLNKSTDLNLEEIQNARSNIILYFQKLGYPFVSTHNPIGYINSKDKNVRIIFPIKLGPKTFFGKVNITGNKKIKKQFIMNRIQWIENDLYNQEKVNNTITELMKTQIISQVKIQPSEPIKDNSDSADTTRISSPHIEIEVEETPMKSVSIGARYSTSTSFGGQLMWNHKNLFGAGESLELSARNAIREQIIQTSLKIPDFMHPNYTLNLRQQYVKEKTRSYKAKVIGSYLDITYKFTKNLRLILGIIYETIKTRSFAEELKTHKFSVQHYGLNSGFSADYSNDALNPTKGFKLSSNIKPYWSRNDKSSNIIDWTSQGSIYLPIIQNQFKNTNFVIASNLKVGMILMKDFKNEAVPNRRFYSGGPNSIRSYGYQKIGPLDINGVPIGGRSLTEWIVEMRSQFTDTVGAVAFFEAGTVMKKGSPILTGTDTMYGTGLGLRYFSSMGPVRCDVGFPLKRRRIPGNSRPIDSAFQVVISIGQSF